jgi:hypothetical protein
MPSATTAAASGHQSSCDVFSDNWRSSWKSDVGVVRQCEWCRRGEQTDAMDRVKLEPMCSRGSGGGGDEEQT